MKFEESLASGPHKLLSNMAGEWAGITKTWFEPDKLSDESPMTGKITSVLGGRFVMHEYNGMMQGKPFDGISIYGYDLNEDKFKASNIDSFHNGTNIMLLNGEEGNQTDIKVLGSYSYKVSPEETQHWGWRIEITQPDKDNMILTIYNITPEGLEAKGVETVYKRVKK